MKRIRLSLFVLMTAGLATRSGEGPAQPLRGLDLHAVALGEHLGDDLAFDAVDHAAVQVFCVLCRAGQALVHQLRRERVEVEPAKGLADGSAANSETLS